MISDDFSTFKAERMAYLMKRDIARNCRRMAPIIYAVSLLMFFTAGFIAVRAFSWANVMNEATCLLVGFVSYPLAGDFWDAPNRLPSPPSDQETR